MVQTSQSLDEHVDTFVPELVPTGGEEIEGVLQVEIIMAVEVAPNKVADLLLRVRVQVLEFMHGRELLDIQPIGEYAVRLPLEKMLALEGGDVRDRCKDVRGMCSGPFDAVSVVDAALPGLGIHVKVVEVVVEVDRTGAKVAAE